MKLKSFKQSFLALFLFLFGSIVQAQYVAPVKNDDLYSFQIANMYFEVDAGFGGRISSLKLNSQEVMFVDRNYGDDFLWGSTLWPAPQDGWPSGGYWFKYFTLDSAGYNGGIVNDSLVLTSGIERDLQFRKTYFANLEDTSVTIRYYVKNAGFSTLNNAAWELTRTPPQGITFFPIGEGDVTDGLSEYTDVINGIVWYEYQVSQVGNRKFKSDGGSQGWYAHVYNDILFIKKFDDVAVNDFADPHKEIEMWLTSDHKYIELENIGKFSSIEPGDSILYEVKWYLREIPGNVTVETGSQSLLDYVSSIANPEEPVIPSSLSLYKKQNGWNECINSINGTIEFKNLPEGSYQFTIIDLTGKVINTSRIESYDGNVFIGQLQNGIYLYKLYNNSFNQSGKLVVK